MTEHPEWLVVEIADAIDPIAIEEGNRYAIAESALDTLFKIGFVADSWHRSRRNLIIPLDDPSRGTMEPGPVEGDTT